MGSGGSRDVENLGIQFGDDVLDAGAEKLGSLFRGIGMDQRRFEQLGNLDMAVGEATVFEHRKKTSLFRRELVGDEPSAEVVVDLLLAGFDLDQAERGADEVDDRPGRCLVGVTEIFLIEVVLVFIEALGEIVLLLIGEVLTGTNFSEDRIGILCITDGLLPAGTVFVLVDPGVEWADFDVGDSFAPAVVAVEFDEFRTSRTCRWRAARADSATGGGVLVGITEKLVVFEEVVDDEALFLDVWRGRAFADRGWASGHGGT
jgi:hypothetical protein